MIGKVISYTIWIDKRMLGKNAKHHKICYVCGEDMIFTGNKDDYLIQLSCPNREKHIEDNKKQMGIKLCQTITKQILNA